MTWSFDNDYGDVLHALSGGPRLVKDGKVCVTAAEEKFRNDVAVGRAPRTAIGITGNRELLLLAVDGRRPSHSIGLTLPELAQWMIDLGATEAMNLDGGGSTTLVINGKVEIPSTGTERRVSNALAVVPATGK
jgi:exopolysaccharide biosynthesis protein